MIAKYESVCYELLCPEQVKELRDRTPIAYIVAGSLEWHSFQNPLGTDSLKAHAICCEAALRYGGIVLPPVYQGLHGDANWGPEGWDGYTLGYTQADVFEALILGIARALVEAHWRVLIGVTGHDVDPQATAMSRAIARATAGRGAAGFALKEGDLHTPSVEIPFEMGHAAAWETSCMQYAYPETVDMVALTRRQMSQDDIWHISGPEGIGGHNPVRYASAEMGQRITASMAELIGAQASTLLAQLRSQD